MTEASPSSRRLRPSKARRGALALAAVAAATLSLLPRPAAAQRELLSRPGEKGHLMLDQLSGFRAGYGGGLTFYGLFGVASQKYTTAALQPAGGQGPNTTETTTTVFLAPNADYFIIDHLSIGGLIELAFTSGSVDVPTSPNSTQTFNKPSTTSVTFLPRVGYMFAITDRFGIWPRGGIGYVSREVVAGGAPNQFATRFNAPLLDLDVGFLYRFTESFYARASPELALTLGGSHSRQFGNTTVTADASFLQFGVFVGFGASLDLL